MSDTVANELPDPSEANRFRGIARIIVFITCCWCAAAFAPRLVGASVWMPIEEIRDPVTFALGLLGVLLALTGGVARATATLPIRWSSVLGLLVCPALTIGGTLSTPRSYAVASQAGRYDLVLAGTDGARRAEVWTCGALRWCHPCTTIDLPAAAGDDVTLATDAAGAWLVIPGSDRRPVGACAP